MRKMQFKSDESGAVAVDWVVLTFFMIGLSLAFITAVRPGMLAVGPMLDRLVYLTRGASTTFDPRAMPGMSLWQNPNDPMQAHWMQEGGNLPGWESLHDLDYRMDIMSAEHNPWMVAALGENGFALDMIGRPGEHLNFQQHHTIAAGETVTLSFKVANADPNATMNAYWGSELLGSFNPSVNQFQTHSFQITGGAGDGTNMLRFESTGGSGASGVYLADVTID